MYRTTRALLRDKNKLGKTVLKLLKQRKKDRQEKEAMAARVEQLEQELSTTQDHCAELENELKDSQIREGPLPENLQLNTTPEESLAAESGQEPEPRSREPEQGPIRPDMFIPYPAPMGDIEDGLEQLPEFRTTGHGKAWSLWEADAALKYIVAGNIKKPNFWSVAKSLRENENANLDAEQQRSRMSIFHFWHTLRWRTTRCGMYCKIEPIEPADEYKGTEKRLWILENFYENKLSRTEQKSHFERGNLEDARPHGDAVEDAKILAEHGHQGCVSRIEGMTVYQYAYQEAYAMKPHLLLELDFPALERLLSKRATMAFNPLITWAQCESIFESIDQHVTGWHLKISNAKWSNLSDYERSKEKTEYARKLEGFEFLEKCGCKLWFHQFPKEIVTSDPKMPTTPIKPAKPGLELGTTSQQYALTREDMAAENDGDPIKQEETNADDEECLSESEQQNIVEKEEIKEDVDHQSSSCDENAKASLTKSHGGSIAAGSTSRNHATGAAKGEWICVGLDQYGDQTAGKRGLWNGKPTPKEALEALCGRSSLVGWTTDEDAENETAIPTDGETTDAEKYNKVRRSGGFDRRDFNNPNDSDASVSRRLRSMGGSNNPQDLNSRRLSRLPASSRMVSFSPRGTSRSQAKRKGGISPGSSPNTKKPKGSSLRREAQIGDSEPEEEEQ